MKKEEIENMMKNWQTPEIRSKADSWEMLVSKINKTDQPFEQDLLQKKNTKVISFQKRIALAVAIAASMLFGVIYFGGSSTTDIHFAEKSEAPVILPDGSKIWVNADSDISYNENTWNENREVTLTGEGFFEVEKGSSFRVITNHGEIMVLGTSFNVLTRANYFEVECYTGKVAVTSSGDKKILTPGKATRLSNENLSDTYTIQELLADWKNDKFRFENQDLTSVFDEISTVYNVEINTAGIDTDSKFFTGNFNIGDINSTLETICLPMALNFQIEGNKITISE